MQVKATQWDKPFSFEASEKLKFKFSRTLKIIKKFQHDWGLARNFENQIFSWNHKVKSRLENFAKFSNIFRVNVSKLND